MRTTEFRYTEWAKWDGKTQRPDWSVLAGVELYDHGGDTGSTAGCFDDYENSNLASQPSRKADVARLSAQLHALVASQPYSGPL